MEELQRQNVSLNREVAELKTTQSWLDREIHSGVMFSKPAAAISHGDPGCKSNADCANPHERCIQSRCIFVPASMAAMPIESEEDVPKSAPVSAKELLPSNLEGAMRQFVESKK